MRTLTWFTEQVIAKGIHLCDDYASFFRVCAAIATTHGEEGREYARAICAASNGYNDRDFDYHYTYALRRGSGKINIGTLYYMGAKAGIEMKQMFDVTLWKRWEKEYKRQDNIISNAQSQYFKHFNISPQCFSRTGVREYENNRNFQGKNAQIRDEYVDSSEIEVDEDPFPLPHLVTDWSYHIPKILRKIVEVFDTDAEKDATLLSSIALLSYFISDRTTFIYGGSTYYPAVYLIVWGDSASSKGSVSKTFSLLDGINERCMDEYKAAMAKYEEEMRAFYSLGKERGNTPMPKKPVLRCPSLAVNSSGPSTIQGIDECNGHVVLLATEMSEMTTANNSDFGGSQNSAILRISFDHDPIRMRRRKNEENIIVKKPIITVILTGTKEQLKDHTKSAENGQFSRGIYLFMPTQDEFVDQWGKKYDIKKFFRSLGEEWEAQIKSRLGDDSEVEMCFSTTQKRLLTRSFSHIHKLSKDVSQEMSPYVKRAIINLIRLMTGFAFIRAMEDWGTQRCLLKPCLKQTPEKGDSPISQNWTLEISDDDYHWMLNMADSLYEHAAHAYSHLERRVVKSNKLREASLILRAMPDQFTAKEFIEEGLRMGFTEATLRTWLNRAKATGIIISVGHGVYIKKKGNNNNKKRK
ncbi:MAG: DUF3987 domain-containing protein [Bacteroidales bacterium]|nr:DUF3987 domain-containing protein [Bacteroidales bacterium]